MICFYGYRGSGKTRAVIRQVYKDWLRNPNLVVFTNTPLFFGLHPKSATKLNQFLYDELENIHALFLYAKLEQGLMLKNNSVVIIDEANLVLPSRLFAKLPTYVQPFLAESRKNNCEIYYTTQHPGRVDTILRDITESFVHCTSIGSVLTICRRYRLSKGLTEKEKIGSWFFYPEKFNDFYDTNYIVGMSQRLGIGSSDQFKGTPIWNFLENNYGLEDYTRMSSSFYSLKFSTFIPFFHCVCGRLLPRRFRPRPRQAGVAKDVLTAEILHHQNTLPPRS